jgi:P2-related tail formation protein
MTEFELVFNYRDVEQRLLAEGYKISPVKTAFFIHNSKGTIVGDAFTVEGLRGFLQGVEWAKEKSNGAN